MQSRYYFAQSQPTTSTSPVDYLNGTITAAQGAANWAGSAALAFCGCLMLAALAAYVVHYHR